MLPSPDPKSPLAILNRCLKGVSPEMRQALTIFYSPHPKKYQLFLTNTVRQLSSIPYLSRTIDVCIFLTNHQIFYVILRKERVETRQQNSPSNHQ